MNKKNRAGFTLVELLIVIVIICILMAMILAVLPGILCSARETAAKAMIDGLSVALGEYYNVYSTYPPDEGPSPYLPPAILPPASAHSKGLYIYLSQPNLQRIPFYDFKVGTADATNGVKSPISDTNYFAYRNNYIRTDSTKYPYNKANKYRFDLWVLNCDGVAAGTINYSDFPDFSAKTINNWQ